LGDLMHASTSTFSIPLLIVFLQNLTKYEINLQNLTLFLGKPSFCIFDAGLDGNKFGENIIEVFMEKE
jgi:hypothetical protein